MTAEIANLAEQLVGELARWWPAVGAAAGAMVADSAARLRLRATEATSDAAARWAHDVVAKIFARRKDGGMADPSQPIPEDTVLDAEVAETLDDLAVDPANRSVHRLLVRYVLDATLADPSLVDVMRALLAEAPPPTLAARSVGTSGKVGQANSGGVNVAVTGITGDITTRDGR